MRFTQFLVRAGFLATFGGAVICAQAPESTATPKRDVLILMDGEKLIGELKSADGPVLVFKSDMAGEVRVDRNRVEQLQTIAPSDVARKGATETVTAVSQPLSGKNAIGNEGWRKGLGGAITGGFALTDATQRSFTYSGAVNLVRSVPSINWQGPGSRTLLDFTAMYGTSSQPGLPTIKTAFYQGDVEEDKYFSPRLFGVALVAVDHNYSQGLQQQEMYGAGIGRAVIRDTSSELDLKVTMSYIHQDFLSSYPTQGLAGSTLIETYSRRLPGGVALSENVAITPAWNDLTAFFVTGGAKLTLPLHGRLGSTLSVGDTFLNDALRGFRKNSLELTAGLTYSMKQ